MHPGERPAVNTTLDHLVVIAPSLEAGVAWCERTLGVTPGPGGQHPLMGTHNRLLRIDGPDFERAYLEIIAIEPGTSPLRQPPLRRWFDMDDAKLMQQVHTNGPQLLHWVARTDALDSGGPSSARRVRAAARPVRWPRVTSPTTAPP